MEIEKINENTVFTRVILKTNNIWEGEFKIRKGSGDLSDMKFVVGNIRGKIKNKDGEIEDIERTMVFPWHDISELIV